MLMRSIILLTILGSGIEKEEKEKQKSEECKKLQGAWKVIKLEPSDLKVKDNYRVIFKDDKVTFGDRVSCKFKLDPSKDPKWFDMDIAPLYGEMVKEVYQLGFYQLDGDKLILAMVTEEEGANTRLRPKDFKGKFPGQIMHLERVK